MTHDFERSYNLRIIDRNGLLHRLWPTGNDELLRDNLGVKLPDVPELDDVFYVDVNYKRHFRCGYRVCPDVSVGLTTHAFGGCLYRLKYCVTQSRNVRFSGCRILIARCSKMTISLFGKVIRSGGKYLQIIRWLTKAGLALLWERSSLLA